MEKKKFLKLKKVTIILIYIDNNFGEIEMCLGEKLTYSIKIKSKNCELYVMQKNDFLRLTVNYKQFIEYFLHKSFMRYLKFTEEKNQMIKEIEAQTNSKSNHSETSSLCRAKGSSKNVKEHKSDDHLLSQIKEDSCENISEISKNIIVDKGSSIIDNNILRVNKTHSLLKSNSMRIDKGKEAMFHSDTKFPVKSSPSGIMNKSSKNVIQNPPILDETQEQEEEEVKKIKKIIMQKFSAKVQKIIHYFERYNYTFNSEEENPKELLIQLQNSKSNEEKNKILDKIETIINKYGSICSMSYRDNFLDN